MSIINCLELTLKKILGGGEIAHGRVLPCKQCIQEDWWLEFWHPICYRRPVGMISELRARHKLLVLLCVTLPKNNNNNKFGWNNRTTIGHMHLPCAYWVQQ